MEDNFVNSVISLYKENCWKQIINNFWNTKDHEKLLWIFPSEENIQFIGDILKETKKDKIISIGCGSGLLEWILKEALEIYVKGLEIDGVWWNCKYAPPAFIPLHLVKTPLEDDISTQNIINDEYAALLFCYFNNGKAFEKYVEYYNGDTIFIIGPGEGRQTHTNPSPFNTNLNQSWTLFKFQEVRDTKDFIAVYRRIVK